MKELDTDGIIENSLFLIARDFTFESIQDSKPKFYFSIVCG